jgi:DNA-directed RNA polymerase specialized sigma24 family protein
MWSNQGKSRGSNAVTAPSPPSDPPAEPGSERLTPEALDGFREACDSHLDFVWRYAHACGVERSALDYVVHKVFAVVRGRLISLEDPSERRVSIAGITRQVVRAYLHQFASPLGPFGHPSEVELAELSEQVEGVETKTPGELVDIILTSMSEAEREVFVLCELESFALFEVAEALHVSESTLRERLSDARKIFNDVSARLRAQRFWVTRGTPEPQRARTAARRAASSCGSGATFRRSGSTAWAEPRSQAALARRSGSCDRARALHGQPRGTLASHARNVRKVEGRPLDAKRGAERRRRP